tara:strand:+ start:107 stop:502 length:396 start_codon:yes stop_codon:yes gene_type:complete
MNEVKEVYHLDQKIEMAIEWIKSMCDNDYDQEVDQMDGPKDSHCCLGVARRVCRPNSEKLFSESQLSAGECNNLGLLKVSMSKLVYLNDGGMGYNSNPHIEIAKIMISCPEDFFIKKVATGISEYFCFGGK